MQITTCPQLLEVSGDFFCFTVEVTRNKTGDIFVIFAADIISSAKELIWEKSPAFTEENYIAKGNAFVKNQMEIFKQQVMGDLSKAS